MKENFNIWITIENDNPEFDDFAKARVKIADLGIKENECLGVILKEKQWINFLQHLSKFEGRFIFPATKDCPNMIMGFPIKIVKELL